MNRDILRIAGTIFVSACTFGLMLACDAPTHAAGSLNLAAEQARLQLADAPQGAEQVVPVQKRLVALKSKGEQSTTHDVVISGQIGGMLNVWPETHPDFPWYAGQASFFLVDSKIAAQFAAHTKGHGNGGSDCVYCKSLAVKNVNAIAVVNFVDERGEILRVDARKLLPVKEHQSVTIRGKARLMAGSMLVIDADGIYVSQ